MVRYEDITLVDIEIRLPEELREDFGRRVKQVPLLELSKAKIEDWSISIRDLTKLIPRIGVDNVWSRINFREELIDATIRAEPDPKAVVAVIEGMGRRPDSRA